MAIRFTLLVKFLLLLIYRIFTFPYNCSWKVNKDKYCNCWCLLSRIYHNKNNKKQWKWRKINSIWNCWNVFNDGDCTFLDSGDPSIYILRSMWVRKHYERKEQQSKYEFSLTIELLHSLLCCEDTFESFVVSWSWLISPCHLVDPFFVVSPSTIILITSIDFSVLLLNEFCDRNCVHKWYDIATKFVWQL